MRQRLLRWMYRVIAPKHPRGWLDFHGVYEQPSEPTTLWVHCHGMQRWGLPNVEVVGVPVDLRGYAHGILCDIVGYMKHEKPMKPDEDFGGPFVSENQTVMHLGTVRKPPGDREGEHADCLRIVDLGEPAESGFPHRLFAAHLIALADMTRNPRKRERLCRRATEIFPGDPGVAELYEPGKNANNHVGWDDLGNALCEMGRVDEGIAALEESVARCPKAAEGFAEHVREQLAREQRPQWGEDPRVSFWTGLDVQAVRERVLSRRRQ